MAKKRNFRATPNVLITGTPGTGKTTFSRMLYEATGFRHVNVGDWVKDRELHTGWDEEHQCFTLDEDKASVAGHVHACVMSRCRPSESQTAQACCIGAWRRLLRWSWTVQVCNALEAQMAEGGNIVDFHSCEFFPERWVDAERAGSAHLYACRDTRAVKRVQPHDYRVLHLCDAQVVRPCGSAADRQQHTI